MKKERLHVCLQPELKSQIEEISEVTTGSRNNYSQTISGLLNDYIEIALEHAKKVRESRKAAIRDAMVG